MSSYSKRNKYSSPPRDQRYRDRDNRDNRDRERDSRDATPKVNSIFKGSVTTVKPFGAFVKIPGCYKNGLIHKSQLSKSNVDDPSEIVQKGDSVWCKVISIDDEGKIGLSMKYVSQGSGQDLDPNGVEMAQDQRRRQPHAPYQSTKIELEAVFNTTCRKCGTSGHLAQDCFQVPGGKKYEMVADDSSEDSEKANSEEKQMKKEKKKSKKHKSEKKKSRKHKSSSSDDESDEPKRKKHKKKK